MPGLQLGLCGSCRSVLYPGSLDVAFSEPRCLPGLMMLREVCGATGSWQSLSSILRDVPTKPREEDWNAAWEVVSSPAVPGPVGWGGNWPLGNHTQLPTHSGQKLYILNSCCLCLAFNLAALTQLPETSVQGTTGTLAFQSYLTCIPSPRPSCHTHCMSSFHF